MERGQYTATVERIAMGTGRRDAYREYLWLRDITSADGVPFAGERWLNHSPTLQRLDLRPGDRIRFEARIEARAPGGIDALEGVTFRLISPWQVSVLRGE